MRAHELFEAPSTDLTTQAGLINFLKGTGFTQTTGSAGYKHFVKPKSGRSAINTLKKTWPVEQSTDKGTYRDDVLSLNGVQLRVTTYKSDGYTHIVWPTSAFSNPDNINIYKVTKYHPGWGYVQDYLDQEGNRSKESVKKAVDSFMLDNGLTPETLKASIAQRTRDNVVHKLYGTD